MAIKIRDATYDDLKFVHEILKHYIENTNLSYEVTTPSMHDLKLRYEFIQAGSLPFIITERDNKILGFAYFRPFANTLNSSFRYTAIPESWVNPDHLDENIGQMQKAELLQRLPGLEIKEIVVLFNHTMSPHLSKFGMDFNARPIGKFENLFEKQGESIDVLCFQFSSGNEINPGPNL